MANFEPLWVWGRACTEGQTLTQKKCSSGLSLCHGLAIFADISHQESRFCFAMMGGKRASPQKTGPGSQHPHPPQNPAEPLGFCTMVLRNLLHGRKPAEEDSHRTPKILQNFWSQAQLFRPCKFFSQMIYVSMIDNPLVGGVEVPSCLPFGGLIHGQSHSSEGVGL